MLCAGAGCGDRKLKIKAGTDLDMFFEPYMNMIHRREDPTLTLDFD